MEKDRSTSNDDILAYTTDRTFVEPTLVIKANILTRIVNLLLTKNLNENWHRNEEQSEEYYEGRINKQFLN